MNYPKQKGNISLITLVLLLIVGISFIGYLYWRYLKAETNKKYVPTSSGNINQLDILIPTGYKAFTDDRGWMGFVYPAETESLQANSYTPIGGVGLAASYNNKEADGTWTIMVVAVPLDDKNIDNDKELSDRKVSLQKYYKRIEDITLGGEKAIVYFYDDNSGKSIQAIHKGVDYTIGFGGGGKSFTDDQKIEDAYVNMIKYFKFLQ